MPHVANPPPPVTPPISTVRNPASGGEVRAGLPRRDCARYPPLRYPLQRLRRGFLPSDCKSLTHAPKIPILDRGVRLQRGKRIHLSRITRKFTVIGHPPAKVYFGQCNAYMTVYTASPGGGEIPDAPSDGRGAQSPADACATDASCSRDEGWGGISPPNGNIAYIACPSSR